MDKTLANAKTRITVIAVLLALILTAVFPFATMFIARADNNDYGIDERKTKFYYFSDSEHGMEYYNWIIQDNAFTDSEFYPIDTYSELTSINFYANSVITEINDAYVIFEVATGMSSAESSDFQAEDVVDVLNKIFNSLSQNNCEVMFINGTDEVKTEGFCKYDNFLFRCPMIHVNTDIFILWLDNIFEQAIEDCGNDLRDCSFIVDNSLIYEYQYDMNLSDFGKCETFLEYFISTFNDIYYNGYNIDQYEVLKLLNQYNVKIFIHVGDDTYYELFNPDQTNRTKCEYVEDLYDLVYNEHIYIADAMWREENEENLLERLNDSQYDFIKKYQTSDEYIKQYLYYKGITPQTFLPNNVYDCASETGLIPIIIDCFIRGGNLDLYNNWEGICNVSYKDIAVGEGGWMRGPNYKRLRRILFGY